MEEKRFTFSVRRCFGAISCFICYFTILLTFSAITGLFVLAISLMLRDGDNEVEYPSEENDDLFKISGIVKITSSRRSTFQSEIDTVYVRMCSSPSNFDYTLNTYRKKYDVLSDGYFEVEISKGHPWILAFLDTSSNVNGSDMIVATLRASNLHSIYVSESSNESEIHFGYITVDSSLALLDDEHYDDLLSVIGMTKDEASIYSSKDLFCLSSVNPDINSDGILDLEQVTSVPHFNLTFTIFTSLVGSPIISIREKNDILSSESQQQQMNMSYEGGGPVLQLIMGPTYSGFFITRWILSITSQTTSTISFVEYNNSFNGIEGLYRTGYCNNSMIDEFEVILFNNNNNNNSNDSSSSTLLLPLYGTIYEYQIFFNDDDDDDEIINSQTFTFTNNIQPFESNNNIEQLLHNFLFPFPVFLEDSETGWINGFSYSWVRYNGTSNIFEETKESEIEDHNGKSSFTLQWCKNMEEIIICESIDVFPFENGFKVSDTVQFEGICCCMFSALEIQDVTIIIRHVSGVIIDLILKD